MKRRTFRRLTRFWRAVAIVSVALLALAPGAGVAAADTATAPSPLDLRGVIDPELIAEMSEVEQSVLQEQERAQQLQQQEQDTETKIQANNQEAASVEQKVSDWNTKANALNEQAAALQERISAHNAEPHTFQLPDQEAQAAEYDAEAGELNSEQSQLQSQQNELDSEKSAISAEQDQVQSQAQQLNTQKQQIDQQITAYNNEVGQLETQIQQLIEQLTAELQAAAAQQAGGTDPTGGDQAAGGDQGRPMGTAQDDGQAGDDGGDPGSPKATGDALDRYAEDNDVTVDKQPVRVLLTPDTVRRLSPGTAAGTSPYRTYDGLAPNSTSPFPNQTYTALEVVAPGEAPDPLAQAINQGGRATAQVGGKTVTITKVQTVPGGRPSPTPPTVPAPDPATLALVRDNGQAEQPRSRTATDQEDDPLPYGAQMPRPLPWEPGTDPGNKPRNDPGRCTENWQDYGPLQNVTFEGQNGQRATGAEACVVSLNKAPRPGLGFPLFGLVNERGEPVMARCHLIGHELNGSDTDLRNFVPCWQDPTNNSWMYWNFENKIALQVAGDDPVYMVVRPIYRDQDPLPLGIIGFAYSNKGWACSTFIPNLTQTNAVNGEFVGC